MCIRDSISSWDAAVAGFASKSDANGIALFISAIPYNFYALLTILMMITLAVTKTDFGPMAIHERNALKGDLFTTEARPYADADAHEDTSKGKVIDLVLPVVVLVIACIIGLIYTGGFFSGESFVSAFANCSASMGLVLGSSVAPVSYTHLDVYKRQDPVLRRWRGTRRLGRLLHPHGRRWPAGRPAGVPH